MSTFGDRTPAQEMLEWIQVVQRECNLSNAEVVTVLLEVIKWFQEEPFNDFNKIQKKLRPYD